MKIFKLLAFSTLLVTASAYADSSTTIHFTSKDSQVHEQFSCVISNAKADSIVGGVSHAEMVTDFIWRGGYAGFVSDVNKYSFDAYHDDKYGDVLGSVQLTVYNEPNATIVCVPNTQGRPVIPGNYGMIKG